MKHLFRSALATGCAVLISTLAVAQDAYPSRPITLVVPFGPGSGTDIVSRSAAKHLSDAFKVPVVVENKPGANGAIGAQAVVRAKPDGYTLLVGSATTNAANFAFYPGKLGYEASDFEFVAGLAGGALALHVSASSPWKSVADLIAAGKDKNQKLSCGSGNAVTQVACEIFIRQAGIDAVNVPYKSNPQSLTDVIGGQVSFAFSDMAASQPMVHGGQLRILALAAAQRSPLTPEIRTFAEQGLPGIQFTGWTGVFAPKGTPAAVMEKLNAEINRWSDSAEATQLRARSSSIPFRFGLQEGRRFAAGEVARWAAYIKESNVKPE